MLKRLYGAAVTPLHRRRDGILSPKKKAALLVERGQLDEIPTLVETGTYRGHTVAACLGHFARIYTIELDPELHAAACERFAHDDTVSVIQGDSCEELLRLAPKLNGPVLFWLDAHYSAGVTAKGPHDPPLEWEIRAILDRGERDAILIDDARLVGKEPGWPSLADLRALVGDRASSFDVRDDIVRINLLASGTA